MFLSLILAAATVLAPKPTPTVPPCVMYLKLAGVAGLSVTPQNVGKLFATALALRIEAHKGTPLENMFTQSDLDASAKDIGKCFLLKDK